MLLSYSIIKANHFKRAIYLYIIYYYTFTYTSVLFYFKFVKTFIILGISVFSPNTGKYGPEKTSYLDTYHAVKSFLMKTEEL